MVRPAVAQICLMSNWHRADKHKPRMCTRNPCVAESPAMLLGSLYTKPGQRYLMEWVRQAWR